MSVVPGSSNYFFLSHLALKSVSTLKKFKRIGIHFVLLLGNPPRTQKVKLQILFNVLFKTHLYKFFTVKKN